MSTTTSLRWAAWTHRLIEIHEAVTASWRDRPPISRLLLRLIYFSISYRFQFKLCNASPPFSPPPPSHPPSISSSSLPSLLGIFQGLFFHFEYSHVAARVPAPFPLPPRLLQSWSCCWIGKSWLEFNREEEGDWDVYGRWWIVRDFLAHNLAKWNKQLPNKSLVWIFKSVSFCCTFTPIAFTLQLQDNSG